MGEPRSGKSHEEGTEDTFMGGLPDPPEDPEIPTFQSFGVNILSPITAFPSPLKSVLVAEVTVRPGTGTG